MQTYIHTVTDIHTVTWHAYWHVFVAYIHTNIHTQSFPWHPPLLLPFRPRIGYRFKLQVAFSCSCRNLPLCFQFFIVLHFGWHCMFHSRVVGEVVVFAALARLKQFWRVCRKVVRAVWRRFGAFVARLFAKVAIVFAHTHTHCNTQHKYIHA